jgi:hypothetical protein
VFTFGETFFCEKVILNRDGSPREFISHFTEVHSNIYPFLFSFSIVTDLFFDEALNKWLSIRIRSSDGKTMFQGARQSVVVKTPPHPQSKITVVSTLENVEFSKPDDYTLYILLDGYVMHQLLLSFIEG